MPKLIIDDIPVEVAKGVSVLEAAQRVGIPIPHFCWHPALGRAGACRVCAVKMLDGPVKGIQMSCMLEAQDGMVVSTTDPEAMAMRRQVIEWLMMNHPHDCPVCDEGGECQLQDFTIAGGHGLRRYTGGKRTYRNQNLGPLIEHEMNRCIQCYRCVRFYQEYAGGADFGVMGSGQRIFYGRYRDGQLESPFSGNILDLCPTGVFTDKTARYRARYWDYEMAPSVCPHCALGCNTIPACHYRELLKIVARRNDAVNGWFICDRGRFSNKEVNVLDRPRYPLVGQARVGWDVAFQHLLAAVRETAEIYGAASLAVVGSPRLSMEAASLLSRLAEHLNAGSLCYFVDQEEADFAAAAAARLDPAVAASMADVRAADMVGLINCDPLRDGPMMALAVRQAWRKGARVYLLAENGAEEQRQGLPFTWTSVSSLAEIPLEDAEKPVVICGRGGRWQADVPRAAERGAKVVCLLEGPNSFGAALLAGQQQATTLSRAVAEGGVKGVIAVEADIPTELLEQIPFVAALDWRNSNAVRSARVFLPTTAWVEMDGTFINNEGRAQRFSRVMQPGLPIRGIDPSLHPPRRYSSEVPGGDLHPAWKILQDILRSLGREGDVEPLSGRWEPLRQLDPEGGGVVVGNILTGLK